MALLSSYSSPLDPAANAESEPATADLSRALLELLRSQPTPPPFPREILTGLTRVAEALLVVVAGVAALVLLAPASAGAPHYFALLLIVASPAISAFESRRVYSIAAFCAPVGPLSRIAAVWAATFAIVWGVCRWLGLEFAPSSTFFASWFLVAIAALMIERLALAIVVGRLARTGRFERRVAVVGGGPQAEGLLDDLAHAPPAELRLLGVFDDRNDERAPDTVGGLPKLGNVDDLVAFARTARVDLIIFALPITAEARIQEMLRKLWVLPIDIRLSAHANRVKLRPRAYSYIGRAPLLDVFDKPLGEWDIVLKAAFDRVDRAIGYGRPVAGDAGRRARRQARLAGPDPVQAEALRLQQRADRSLQVPVDVRAHAGPARQAGRDAQPIRA